MTKLCKLTYADHLKESAELAAAMAAYDAEVFAHESRTGGAQAVSVAEWIVAIACAIVLGTGIGSIAMAIFLAINQ